MSKINGISNTEASSYTTNPMKITTESSDFSSYLGESQSLDKIFDAAANKYNISVELLKSVAKAESNFKSDAVSRSGAQGIMQLMPATAKGLGVTNSFDPEQNIMGGAKYLSGLLKKYDGNTKLALAAYNAGSGNVAKYGGIPPFKETQNYVVKVMGFMNKAGTDTSGDQSDSYTANTSSTNYLHVSSATIPTQVSTNYGYLISGTSTGDPMMDLQNLFTYDEYMKFLELFLKDENEDKSTDYTKNYGEKDINYNVPVLNLLNGTELLS